MANIVGGVTSINNPRTNWAQTDKTKADFLKNKPSVANALKGTASGEAISITDASPIEHEMGVKVWGKNLLIYPYQETTKTDNGITFTDNGDGTITANGTATQKATFYLHRFRTVEFSAGNYIASGCPTGGSYASYRIEYSMSCNGEVVIDDSDLGNGVKWNAPNGIDLIYCAISVAAGATVENLTFYPQIEEGTTATAYTPYIEDISTVKVKKYGKNLLDLDAALNSVLTKEGDVYTLTRINGTNLSGAIPIHIPAKTTVTWGAESVEYTGSDNIWIGLAVQYQDGSSSYSGISIGGSSATFTTQKDTISMKPYIMGANALGTYAKFKNFQLEMGSVATAYEMPVITEYPVNANGTVGGVTPIYPTTTLMTDTAGAVMDCTYNRDANKVITDLETKLNTLIATIGG